MTIRTLMTGLLAAALCMGAWSAEPDEAIELFNGKDLTGWKGLWQGNDWFVAGNVTLGYHNKTLFAIEHGEGLMVNSMDGRTTNLITEYQHGDCHLYIEFVVPHQSNSGVYFQGLYEIQVFDSYGQDKVQHSDCGGIYQRWDEARSFGYEGRPPRVNASNPPGVWQSFEAVFRAPRFNDAGEKIENARFISVKHNGVLVHQNVEVTGPTRAHMNKDEAPLGPLMLQGDHGPVAYRNIRLTPLQLK